jgi:hypothetical protein
MLKVWQARLRAPEASFLTGVIATFLALLVAFSISLPSRHPPVDTVYVSAVLPLAPAAAPWPAVELVAPPARAAAAPLPRPRPPHTMAKRARILRAKPQTEPRQAQIRQGRFCFLICADFQP